jgi:hypothetical protein
MSPRASIVAASQIIAHTPDLIAMGSKPSRVIAKDPQIGLEIAENLRSAADAAAYLPNQIFIGAEPPRGLLNAGRPWWSELGEERREGSHGLFFEQSEFLEAMARVDRAGLVVVHGLPANDTRAPQRRVLDALPFGKAEPGSGPSLDVPITTGEGISMQVAWGYPGDEALSPPVVLENTAGKASGALALARALEKFGVDAGELDYVISCSEEAVGDRYQRGGGNLGKAIAESVGAVNASGFDVKDFCAAPIPALVVASALIESGVARTVAVAAGGSVPKLGMKFQGHLQLNMPVLEDCLGAVAVILRADGEGPRVRLDAVGKHPVAAGGSNQKIFEELIFAPLDHLGIKAGDIDAFGTELHNPELTEPQGSGDVPLRNYKMIGALAARMGHIDRADIDDFLGSRAFAGFAPTQGHIASAVCLLPYVRECFEKGTMSRVQLIAKASLFLGKMSGLSDGASLILEV